MKKIENLASAFVVSLLFLFGMFTLANSSITIVKILSLQNETLSIFFSKILTEDLIATMVSVFLFIVQAAILPLLLPFLLILVGFIVLLLLKPDAIYFSLGVFGLGIFILMSFSPVIVFGYVGCILACIFPVRLENKFSSSSGPPAF